MSVKAAHLCYAVTQCHLRGTFSLSGLRPVGSVSHHELVLGVTTLVQRKRKVGFDHRESIEGSLRGEISGMGEGILSLPLPHPPFKEGTPCPTQA